MKNEFTIVKYRPTIQLKLTRDSVCMSDDIDAPHEKIIIQPSFTDTIAFINNIKTGYLPNINGVGHTWNCILNGTLIGIVSSTEITPKIKEINYQEENSIHFKYNSSKF